MKQRFRSVGFKSYHVQRYMDDFFSVWIIGLISYLFRVHLSVPRLHDGGRAEQKWKLLLYRNLKRM
jgi:hypothetical protein